MVSIAIVTGISVVFASLQTSTARRWTSDLARRPGHRRRPADGGVPARSTRPDGSREIRAAAGVDRAVGRGHLRRCAAGTATRTSSRLDDVPPRRSVLEAARPSRAASTGSAAASSYDEQTATDRKLTVGSTLTVAIAKGAAQTLTMVGITSTRTHRQRVAIFQTADAQTGFAFPQPIQAFVEARDGRRRRGGRQGRGSSGVLADKPEVIVLTSWTTSSAAARPRSSTSCWSSCSCCSASP